MLCHECTTLRIQLKYNFMKKYEKISVQTYYFIIKYTLC